MNVLNYQSPASGNGQYYYSVLPASSSFSSSRVPARPSCSKYYHRPQHRHQDYACHRQHLLPVALTLPPPPLPASPPRSVQPSRSSCSPTPPLVGNSINIGGSPPQRDDHHEPLPIHRSSADHDAVVDEELMGPLITSGTLGFVDVRSLMDDDDDEYRYLRQQTSQEYYYHTAGRLHLDRPQRQQHQQLLLSPDQEPAPPRVVQLTLAVSVASAVKLQSKQMDQIAKKMRKLTGFEHLRMENTVDPSLIAGFVISYGGDDAHHVIDLSVKGRLAEMEARLQSSGQTAGAASIPGMH